MLSRSATATLLLAVAALALPASSHAQLIDRFGVKAGVVSASASAEFSEEVSGDQFGRRTGWAASVFAEKRVLPFLSMVGEVGYVQRGFVERLDHYVQRGIILAEDDRSAQATSRLDYLTIPVMAKLGYDLAPATLYAMAGPRIDVLLDRERGWFELRNAGGRFRGHLARSYDSTAIGGTVGLGIATESWFPARVLLETRYDFDVTDSYPLNPEVRSNTFSVVAGIAF